MKQYTLIDYCKEAFYYSLHHIYFDDTIQILDSFFSMDDVCFMANHYLEQSSTDEEKKIYEKVEKIKKLKQYSIVMKRQGQPIDSIAEYLEHRKITKYMVETLLIRVDKIKKYMPEEWEYLNSLVKQMSKDSEEKYQEAISRKKKKRSLQSQRKDENIQKIKVIMEDFLSDKNYIPIFQYYCSLNYISLTTVNKYMYSFKIAYPDLYHQFLEKDSKKDSTEYKDQLMSFVDNVLLMVSDVVYTAYSQNRDPDLIDYYKNIPVSYYGLLKTVNQFYTKKENNLLRSFYHDIKSYSHFFAYEKYISETLSSMSDSYSEEEEKNVCQKLEKIGFPILTIARFNHTGLDFNGTDKVTKVYFK